MITFQYKAATSDGGVVDGLLLAENREHVVRQLRALGQIPIRIDETRKNRAAESTARRRRFRRSRIGSQQVADATRELATLLSAGMPLDRALGTLVTLSGDDPVGAVLGDIRSKVKEGATMAEAVEAHQDVFGRFYVNLLRAGESGGALEIVLERLAEHLDRNIEIGDALKSALIYPAILIVVALLSIFVLLGYVVPQFTEMFEGVGQALPLSTRITIATGEFLQSWGWLLAVAAVLGALLLQRQLEDPEKAYRWHDRLLRAPLIGPVVLKIEVARFARTLATLLRNGIPLLKGLGIVRDTMGNRVLAAGLDRVAGGLKEGQSLADPLAKSTRFPAFAVQMIKVGEESGNLPEILLQVASTYDRDTQVTIKRSLALLEPLLILVLGAIIAAVIISILVAILGINELVI
ncbi:MAG: type II secretion system F family protein [Gammaproteobacteria bacterium]|nr:type II secretion system F family protein [Gammaproteobacteria bacterium]MDH4253168.1 type II secretion system F family protein [Gammaproteobacteria bacterium]MDH5308470.1 type II secretion system F family protein [Gammaproteobacteria bacterium]